MFKKIVSKKIALTATSIVNPTGELLNLVDTIISISDVLITQVLDTVFYTHLTLPTNSSV
nr:hypothetical protein [Mesomycoplasma hyorhinis]